MTLRCYPGPLNRWASRSFCSGRVCNLKLLHILCPTWCGTPRVHPRIERTWPSGLTQRWAPAPQARPPRTCLPGTSWAWWLGRVSPVITAFGHTSGAEKYMRSMPNPASEVVEMRRRLRRGSCEACGMSISSLFINRLIRGLHKHHVQRTLTSMPVTSFSQQRRRDGSPGMLAWQHLPARQTQRV